MRFIAYSEYAAHQLLNVARNLAEDVDTIVGERHLVDDIRITICIRADGRNPTVEVDRKYSVPTEVPPSRTDA